MKRCIVLAGGGAKGAYQIGFWKALRELKIEYDMACGTSVGALNATFMAQGDYDTAYEMWTKITTDNVVIKSLKPLAAKFDVSTIAEGLKIVWGDFANDAIKVHMESLPLRQMLQKHISEDKTRLGGKDLGIMAAEYPIIKPAPMILSDIQKGSLIDWLLASSCVYPSMDPVVIDDKKYIDGGYSDNCPIGLALDMGADEIIACELNGGGVSVKVQTTKSVKTIKPHFYLGPTMDFNPDTSISNITLGYLDTMREFGKYDGHWYSFVSGEREKFLKDYSFDYSSIFVSLGIIKNELATKYYEHITVKQFAESCEERPKRMRYDFPMLVAEYTADKLGVLPYEVFTGESIGKKVLERYSDFEYGWKNVENIFKKDLALNARAKLLKNIDPTNIISFAVHKLASLSNSKKELKIIERLFPGNFFAAVYIAKLKGII